MEQLLLTLCLLALSAAQNVNQCPGYGGNSGCVRPPNFTNFTRLPVLDIVSDIRFYFPSNPTPPPSDFISDTRTIPTITFTREGPLRVVYLFEGAGYRNQLGYFTFTGTPPNVQIQTRQLLFPDINDVCIYPGMQVSTPVLPAGTKIGFYLLADGCNTGETNANKYYTLSNLNNPDANVRHVGLYVDYFRELLIIGFEDLTRASWDNDFEDTMFIFDAEGLVIDFGGLPYACTNPPCRNGGVCNYNTGQCDCTGTKYMAVGCATCNCTDNKPCTDDICNGAQCVKRIWTDNIDSCVAAQTCSNPTIPCPTTAEPTTAQPTTAQPTTAQATTRQATTAQATTANPTTAQPTFPRGTTANPTTAQPTTGQPTTAVPTTAWPTTGEERLTNTRTPPTNPTTAYPVVNTISYNRESSASALQLGAMALVALLLVF